MEASTTSTSETAAPGWRRLLNVAATALLLAMIPAYVALTWWSAPEFRGSDQYWYVEDVDTILRGEPAGTHETYPYFEVVDDERFSESRPPIHNVPALYVWAGVAKVLGDTHRGILATNILSALLAALLCYLTARRFLPRTASLAAAVFLLWIPVGFWVASQDMAETFSGMLIALAVWLVVRWPERFAAYAGAVAIVALAAAGRIWALPYVLLLPLGLLLLDRERGRWSRLGRTAGAAAIGLACYLPLSRLFASYMPPLDPMVILEVSRTNNMVMYYRLEAAPPFDLGVFIREMWTNTLAALKAQFSPFSRVFPITVKYPAADRMPVNWAALVAAAGLFTRGAERLERIVMGLGVGALAIHLAMATIYLNQPRYIVVMLAPLVLGTAVTLGLWWRRPWGQPWMRYAIVFAAVWALAGATYVDVHNARYYRTDALGHAQVRASAADLIAEADIPADARVVLDTALAARWPIDFALGPRPVLSLATDFPYDEATCWDLIEGFGGQYVVVDGTSKLAWSPRLEAVAVREDYAVYRIVPGAWR